MRAKQRFHQNLALYGADADRVDSELAHRVGVHLAAERRELRAVAVAALGGTVTLSGTVRSFHAKQLAISLVRRVGVSSKWLTNWTLAGRTSLPRRRFA
jgi:osmotically-inducible protein OsmY